MRLIDRARYQFENNIDRSRWGIIMKDHTSHNTQPTAVGDHCRDHGHAISKNNVEVIAREEGWFTCRVREANEIKTRQPTINRYQEVELPAICQRITTVPT